MPRRAVLCVRARVVCCNYITTSLVSWGVHTKRMRLACDIVLVQTTSTVALLSQARMNFMRQLPVEEEQRITECFDAIDADFSAISGSLRRADLPSGSTQLFS